MAIDFKTLKTLGVNAIRKTLPAGVPSDYSVSDVEASFYEKVKEVAHDRISFQRNKLDLFELLQEVFTEVEPKRVLQTYGAFADVRTVGHGQKITFKQKIGRQRAKHQFVTRVGLGGVFETFRLDTKEFDVATEAIGGAAVVDWERYLSGDESIAEVFDVLMEGIDEYIYKMIAGILNASINATRPLNTFHAANTFDKEQFDILIRTVRAYGDPVIVATPAFIDTMPVNYVKVTDNGDIGIKISETDLEDIRSTGFIRMYKGCPIIMMQQSFVDETNTEEVLDDQFAYILPTAGQKLVQVIFEGDMQIGDFQDKSLTMEIAAYQKVGVAILHFNNWAIYQNTSLA